jgi:hypothetical protein
MLLDMTTIKIVAIHQPNFLPWLGFFNKIIQSDTFILFDDVQFPKTGGVWTNRHYFLDNGIKKLHTVAISRNFSGSKKINEIKLALDMNWREQYLKKITHSYSKAKYFLETYQFLEQILDYKTEFLCDLNIHLINAVLSALDISNTSLVKSSSLLKSGSSNELLCSLTKAVGANTYLSGGGADGYMDESVFTSNKINIVYQNYNLVGYSQINSNEFVPGLTIIDAMMNCGFKETKKLVIGADNV